MPTTFLGLFLFSTALALMATFVAVTAQATIRRIWRLTSEKPRRLR
jgi:dihydroorotase-like cyclic amidohydrolase